MTTAAEKIAANRESIAKRMKALAAMTIENGASENEALIAFTKLQDMQHEYNMTLDEAAIVGELYGIMTIRHIQEHMYPVMQAILKLTNTDGAIIEETQEFIIAGSQHDCLYAEYLAHIARDSFGVSFNPFIISKKYQELRKTYGADQLRYSFYVGMSTRLATRILEMVEKEENEGGLNALMVLKNSKAQETLAAGGYAKTGRALTNQDNLVLAAGAEGVKAGDKISLNNGITSNNTPDTKLIANG